MKTFKDSDLVYLYNSTGALVAHLWYATARNIYRERLDDFKIVYSKSNCEKNVKQFELVTP